MHLRGKNRVFMKRVRFLSLLLALGLYMLTGCTEAAVEPSGLPSHGVFYTTVKGLSFYFLDEAGNDCISFDDPTTWPLTFARVLASAERRELAYSQVKSTSDAAGRPVYQYNDQLNSISFDEGEQLWKFQTYFWGESPLPQFPTYVFLRESMAEMVVSYQYVQSGSDTANGGWGVDVTSVTFNGTEVFRGNASGKVFIRKSAQGGALSATLVR